jgi:hypothetical protein
MWTVGERVFTGLESHPESTQEKYFRVLYLAGVLWIVFVGFLSGQVMSVLVQQAV